MKSIVIKLLLLSIICNCLEAAVQWPTNGHFYDVLKPSSRPSQFTDALTWAASQKPAGIPAGYVAYVGNINTAEELAFILSKIPAATSNTFYVSSVRGDTMNAWKILAGPETGQIHYDTISLKCLLYCNWAFGEPDNLQANNIYYDPTAKAFLNGLYSDAGTLYFLIEWGPANEPFIPPVPTSGATVTVTTNGCNTAKTNITFTPSGGQATQLTVLTTTTNTVQFKIPPGGNISSFAITDGSAACTFSNPIYKYLTPAIELVYPSLITGTQITITGQSFGSVASDINIKLGFSSVSCTSPVLITPHTQLSCNLPFTPTTSTTIFPLSIQIGSSNPFYSLSFPIYDKYNMRAIAFNPSQNSYDQGTWFIQGTPGYAIQGYTNYGGIPSSPDQISMSTLVFPFASVGYDFHVSIVGTSNSCNMKNFGGPFDGTPVINALKKCDATKLVACPNGFAGGVGPETTSYFQYRDSIYGQNNANDDGQHGNIIMFGITPKMSDSGNKYFNTSGGFYNVTFAGGVGFAFTKRTLLINGVSIPQANLQPFFDKSVIQVNVPAGTGGPKSSVFGFESAYNLAGPGFGYYAPWISSTSNPSTLGDALVINGVNFGNNKAVVTVTIDTNINCPVTSISIPHNQITCTIPAGVGTHSITVNVDGQVQTNTYSVVYAAPAITSITQNGVQLSVSGTNFGSTQSAISVNLPSPTTVSLGGILGSTYTVVVTLPIIVKNGLITITVAGQTSVGYPWNYVPIITGISPNVVNSVGGDVVVITGQFLNANRQDNSAVNATIQLGGKECGSPYFSSNSTNTMVQCNSPKGTGKNLPVQVTIDDKPSNILNSFSYLPPVVTAFTQVGTVATIAGQNFGEDFSVVSVTYNGVNTVPATSINLLRNSVVASIPYDTTNGIITVTVNGQTSDSFNIAIAPMITGVSDVPTAGGNIVLTGYYFNPTDYKSNPLSLSVTFDGQPCTNPVITTPNFQLKCNAPAGTGANLTVEVSIQGAVADFLVSYLPPQIVTVSNSPNSFTISGTQFGSDSSLIQVVYTADNGSVIILSDSVYTNNSVQSIISNSIPENAINGPISVIVNRQSSNQLPYTLVPIISSASNPPTMGGQITITGSHLTSYRSDGTNTTLSVQVNGFVCMYPEVQSFESMVCNVSYGTGIKNSLVVSIDNSPSNTILLAYMAPSISSFEQEDLSIKVSGQNFGMNTVITSITFDSASGPISSVNQNVLMGPIPTQSRSGQFKVTVDGQDSNLLDINIKPVLQSISSTGTSGGEITIVGYFLNFYRQNVSSTNLTVDFLTSPPSSCTNPQSIFVDNTYTALTCQAPAGSGFNIPVRVTIDGKSDTIPFSYGAPTLTSVKVSKSNLVVVTGTNFGNDASSVQVTLSGEVIEQFTLTDDTHLQFIAPTDAVNGMVTVSVQSRTSNGIQANLYPILSGVSMSETQGSLVVLTGSYLNQFSYGGYPNLVEILVDNQNCTDLVWLNSSSQVTCLAPPGTGIAHNIGITIEGLPANSLPFKYYPPAIQSITQDGNTLTIDGENFGNYQPKVSISNNYQIQSVNHTQVVVTLPTDALNNQFTITVDGQISNPFLLEIAPLITSTTSTSPYGGAVTITGSYLNEKDSNGNENTVTISIGGLPCSLNKTIVVGKQFLCTIGESSLLNAQVLVSIGSKNGTGIYTSVSPSITSSSQLFYMIPGNVTITGQEFINPLVVYIGNDTCSSPDLVSPTTVVCKFNSTQVLALNEQANITIQSGLLNGFNSVFSYYIEDCEKNCSNNGLCYSGFCQCNSGFSGSLCDIKYDAQVLPTLSSYTSTFKASNISFTVEIAGIREVTSAMESVKFVGMDTLNWTLGNSNQNPQKMESIYIGNSSENISLQLTTTQWLQNSLSHFVGQVLPSPSNSVKHSIVINSWPFASQMNSLQLVYKVSYISDIFECKNVTANTGIYYNLLTNQMSSFTLDTPYAVLTGTFSNRVNRDSIGNLMAIQSSNQTTTEIPVGNNTILVSLNIPSFETSVAIDPIFVSYSKITTDSNICNTDNGGGSKSNKWLIPVIVVGSMLGAIAIGAGGYMAHRKRKQNIEMKKKMVQMDINS
ncbi:IPT/TIG domain-containing protein [Heterostelium album PN500]|uniref:IPT/TIG domain-containing protein n=1 Tax=Heterostelium pallidum (strain ATCC 26659 / Pp 5 / PN500) TaxID=670386 RepID=D3BRD0_HETP5|nr:IPT/TIG domain-containing protein [Heterostelium album PN500]EFA75962.1 IPT/TIG domain-containing protein [Heterostelium album PN500]|eukprot:XP_020428096.1 IPT/TIG domain-containing protein [Heterostelium album PN500]